MKTNKISIIGAGFVGSTTAFALMNHNVASEIVIVDIAKEKALGEAMDLQQGEVFVAPVTVRAGDYKDTADSDLIIITAGVAQKPEETRLDLVNRNVAVFSSIVPELVRYSPNSILLVVSNPVDILTYITYKLSGFPAERVFGSGTVLDTARFKSMLAKKFGVDGRNIHANIIGEHGDSEIATWSLTTIAGLTIEQYCDAMGIEFPLAERELMAADVKGAAYEIINRKGHTNYAVALAITRITQAILRDEHSILTVSSLLHGEYGVEGIYTSVPTIVTRTGVKQAIEIPISSNELHALQKSANILKDVIAHSAL